MVRPEFTETLMKKLVLLGAPFLFALIVFFALYFLVLRSDGKGALQVTSEPKSNVYLDGKLVGQTPLCKCEPQTMLKASEYTIRLVPVEGNYAPFENRITITKSVLTAVDRSFSQGAESFGSIITLTPLPASNHVELLVMSYPDNAKVLLDNNEVGTTPLLLKNTTDSDHEVKLEKEGYKEKIVRIRTIRGYKLSSTIFMGIDPLVASESAQKTGSPSATLTPKVTKVVILDTPTGFLRVRSDATIGAEEVTRVNPGDEFELINEKEGWFAIKLANGKTGWVSQSYAKKQ